MKDLSHYVTNVESDVYGLINLPEEVIAVLFAFYSRSAGSLKDNLSKLLKDEELNFSNGQVGGNKLLFAQEQARNFHEKWVLGYGHASVAEHAVAHIAVENISILLSKVIEDSRLASFTEKSSRYVFFKNTDFYPLNEIEDKELLEEYQNTAKSLIEDYSRAYEEIYKNLICNFDKKGQGPCNKDKIACKKITCDIVRYFLPTSTYTNLGMTANGRELAHIISKMLSNPLEESKICGKRIKEEGMKLIPTLVKYASEKSYMKNTSNNIRILLKNIEVETDRASLSRSVTLVKYQEDPEFIVAASILYEHIPSDYGSLVEDLEKQGLEYSRKIIDEFMKDRGEHDQPLRNLEHVNYTFDILIDYGAFRDIQRHRIATQSPQIFTNEYGFSKPEEISEFNLDDLFDSAMSRAEKCYLKLKDYDPVSAQYILPLAFRKRVLFSWNLRELHHFITLRTSNLGHLSYRKIAYEVFKEVKRVHPFLAEYIRYTEI